MKIFLDVYLARHSGRVTAYSLRTCGSVKHGSGLIAIAAYSTGWESCPLLGIFTNFRPLRMKSTMHRSPYSFLSASPILVLSPCRR